MEVEQVLKAERGGWCEVFSWLTLWLVDPLVG